MLRKVKRTPGRERVYQKAPRHKELFIDLKDSQYGCLSNQETEGKKQKGTMISGLVPRKQGETVE